MPAIILKLLAPLTPYLAAAVILLSGILYVSHLKHSLTAASAANAALLQTNQEDAAAITAYQAQAQKWNAALDALDAQTLAAQSSADGIINTINAAPPNANAPVAPVLANALAQIAKLQGQQP